MPQVERVCFTCDLSYMCPIFCNNRDLKITFMENGKPQTLYLFAIKTKSLTVKCFTYTIYLEDRKLRTETLHLTTKTWRLIRNDCSLQLDVCRFYNWMARQACNGSLQTSNVNSNV